MTTKPKIYKVGGCVRDALLGVNSKDIDFTFVLPNTKITVEKGFQQMTDYLNEQGFKIFLSTPECFTIRAKFPEDHPHKGIVGDFVLARKEEGYIEGTRRPKLKLGTLYDDLLRRDFTINAIAEDENGVLIDMFNGVQHLERKMLITPQDPNITMMEDPLRMLRAMRFSLTKNLQIHKDIYRSWLNPLFLPKLQETVSNERIREELTKCFKYNTPKTIELITNIGNWMGINLFELFFKDGIWLMPTNKQ